MAMRSELGFIKIACRVNSLIREQNVEKAERLMWTECVSTAHSEINGKDWTYELQNKILGATNHSWG